MVEDEVVQLGTAKLPFKFRNPYLGKFAFHLTKPEDATIVYCSLPSTADKVALDIADQIQEESDDTDLYDLASFLRQEIHPRYLLATLVRKGVAFHYGNIPQIIRGRLEELLRDRKLRFVCCTSTLLQGINLPAKNIFVEDPKKGRGTSMQKGDFWNLVGRAGRLSMEFRGNVFCIFGKEWKPDVTSDRLAPIESAFQVAVKERTAELLHAVREPPDSSESRELSWAEQAYARIYADFVSSGKRLADSSDGPTKPQLEQIDLLSEAFNRTLPNEIFVNNLYVHPARLESLASFLRSQRDLLSWMPSSPYAQGAYERLLRIFQLIEELLVRSHTQQYKYHANLAWQWMRGASLRELVENKIRFAKVGTDVGKINGAIRELFEDLETELRYKYVKYTRIYADVLRAVLVQAGLREQAEALLPIHLFLEYGAANQTLINFMAVGLSRTSALLLKSSLSLRDTLTTSECQGYLNRVNLDRSTLPAICKAEIARLRRTNA